MLMSYLGGFFESRNLHGRRDHFYAGETTDGTTFLQMEKLSLRKYVLAQGHSAKN